MRVQHLNRVFEVKNANALRRCWLELITRARDSTVGRIEDGITRKDGGYVCLCVCVKSSTTYGT